jgi:hypothetical protein
MARKRIAEATLHFIGMALVATGTWTWAQRTGSHVPSVVERSSALAGRAVTKVGKTALAAGHASAASRSSQTVEMAVQ